MRIAAPVALGKTKKKWLIQGDLAGWASVSLMGRNDQLVSRYVQGAAHHTLPLKRVQMKQFQPAPKRNGAELMLHCAQRVSMNCQLRLEGRLSRRLILTVRTFCAKMTVMPRLGSKMG